MHVTASGSLSAVVSVDVGSQVSGKIVALYADFNSPVKKGQLVAEIDTTVYAAALRQAEGDLASARADVTLKRQNLERKKILVPKKAASQLDLDQATAELAQAEALVIIKEAAVESAKANLGYCKITAPVDGIVISRKVDVGQTVIAAMSTPVLFTIAQDITKMNISAAVSEADIGQVRDGQAANFGVDAFPDEVFHGQVSQVRRAPTTTQNVVTYETMITVDNPQQKLFPGMTADVSILVSARTNVVKIPNAALRYTPPEGALFQQTPPAELDHGQRLVYTVGPAGPRLTPLIVKVGLSDGVDTEVLSGVTEGTPLVTATLSGGAKPGSFGGPPPQAP
jgi:HlyD family secretion protein